MSGDGLYEQDSNYVKIDQVDLSFSCKLMRVSLDRGWMNPLVLSSKAWRWTMGSPTYGVKFSSGADIAADVAPTGVMTVIPTAAILSSDLKITGNIDQTTVDELNKLIKAEASVGIGPFSVAGKFNMENHNGSQKGTIATNGITAPDVQIIAMVCEVLPMSPDPDAKLKWPTE